MHQGPSPPASDSLAIACGAVARIWRPLSGETSEPLSLFHNGTCTSLKYNHNNKVLASATDEGKFSLHYHTGSLMGELPADSGFMGPINTISFSRGSKLLAAGCADARLHLWDLKSQVLQLWVIHGHNIALVAVSRACCEQLQILGGCAPACTQPHLVD